MARRWGSIETLPDGRKRARKRVDGELVPVGIFETEAAAAAALVLFSEKLAERRPVAGHTLTSWGVKWLDAREKDGVHRDVKRDRHVWKRIEAAPFARLPLAAITPRDVRDWIGATLRTVNPKTGAKPARQTVANALNLLRVALEDATNGGYLERNPARDVRIPKVAVTDEKWTYLHVEELAKLLGAKTPADLRDLYTVAVYTGLRAGELFGLEWRDVDLVRAMAKIRFSWRGTPTKRGAVRTLHLFDVVVEALERQRKRSGSSTHVFPAADGEARTKDQMPSLRESLVAVGITRRVRFHDLRHTCASHLISGSWGRAWTIEETAKHLGHKTSVTTRRYAHLAPEGIAKAARETGGTKGSGGNGGARSKLVPSFQTKASKRAAQVPESSGGSAIRTHGAGVPLAGFQNLAGGESERGVTVDPGTFRERATALLEGLREGTTTAAEVAELAAEWLAKPDPVRRAAERFAALVGTEHEGMAAVGFLDALAADGAGVDSRHRGTQ